MYVNKVFARYFSFIIYIYIYIYILTDVCKQ